jgi:hypothetical protein
VLSAWRLLDHRADRKAMRELVGAQPAQPPVFAAEMVANLPEPARRYFLYTIEPGTPLATVARIRMTGRFGMGDRSNPNYLDFEATQVLAMPSGFAWKMHARRGLSPSVNLKVSADGQPVEVSFHRWSNANPKTSTGYSRSARIALRLHRSPPLPPIRISWCIVRCWLSQAWKKG